MPNHLVLGIHVADRRRQVPAVQKLLSDFGCSIKTRLGLHDAGDDHCATTGLIILELCGPAAPCRELEQRLKKLRGVQVKKMVFSHV